MNMETVVNSSLTAVELVVATLMFASGLPRRRAFALRGTIACAALAVVIGTFMSRIASSSSAHLAGLIVLYAMALVFCCATVGFCCEATTWTAL